MSHNACCVTFADKKIRLPRFNIGESVLYRKSICLVNGVYCPVGGSVVYHIESSDGSLSADVYEHDLFSSGKVPSKKLEMYCGFRVGDTVVDTGALLRQICVVEGFDYKRQAVKVRIKKNKWCYLVAPADLKFINPVTLQMSKERKILDEKENHN